MSDLQPAGGADPPTQLSGLLDELGCGWLEVSAKTDQGDRAGLVSAMRAAGISGQAEAVRRAALRDAIPAALRPIRASKVLAATDALFDTGLTASEVYDALLSGCETDDGRQVVTGLGMPFVQRMRASRGMLGAYTASVVGGIAAGGVCVLLLGLLRSPERLK